MALYDGLVAALGNAYDSDAMAAVLAGLPPKKGLKKEGGYRASLNFKPLGLYLIFEYQKPQWLLSSAMLFPEGVDRYGAFPEPVDGRLMLASKRADVRAAFGPPSRSGGSGKPLGHGLIGRGWDRYDRDGHSLRFDYDDADGAIHVATLMSAATAAKLNPDLQATAPAP